MPEVNQLNALFTPEEEMMATQPPAGQGGGILDLLLSLFGSRGGATPAPAASPLPGAKPWETPITGVPQAMPSPLMPAPAMSPSPSPAPVSPIEEALALAERLRKRKEATELVGGTYSPDTR